MLVQALPHQARRDPSANLVESDQVRRLIHCGQQVRLEILMQIAVARGPAASSFSTVQWCYQAITGWPVFHVGGSDLGVIADSKIAPAPCGSQNRLVSAHYAEHRISRI